MKFSIITVNFNNRDGLLRTIQSVIAQTFRDFEFIVIDGGSTDGSADLLKQYDQHITYWVSEKDSGIYNGMNKGIARAKGDYLNFMNSGDCFYDSQVLQRVSDHIEASPVPANGIKADIIVGRDYHYSEEKKMGHASIQPTRLSMITFFTSTLDHQSSFIRRKLFQDSLYREDLRLVSDWVFFLEKVVVENKKVQFIPDIVCYREVGGITWQQYDKNLKERDQYIHQLIPQGVYNDYATLAHLDKETLFKLFRLCENSKAAKWLTISIKVISRLFK